MHGLYSSIECIRFQSNLLHCCSRRNLASSPTYADSSELGFIDCYRLTAFILAFSLCNLDALTLAFRMLSRSSSARAPKTVSINRPWGVVVSMFSFRLTNSTLFSVRLEMIVRRSLVFLAIREMIHLSKYR